MKKGTIIHVVVMVVAVIAGTMLAIKLNNDQRALIPEKAELAAIPVGGFHKFAADVEWMLFVNYIRMAFPRSRSRTRRSPSSC